MYENGRMLSVNGRNIAVSEIGEGDRTIVFIPGLASPSTTVEFRGVAEFLKDKYRMIFVDPLGYGMSDRTDEPRKTEIVADELHQALSQLDLKKYIIAAHSLSGLAALEYSNRYTDEVEAVVGIDCSVPKQYEIRSMIERSAKTYEKRGKIKDSFVNKKVSAVICKMSLKGCKDHEYSKEDIELYTRLSIENCDSSVTLDEIRRFGDNALSLSGKKFPDSIPVLFLLSKQTIKQIPDWKAWHEDLFSGGRGRIVLLDGNHMLHLTAAKAVAENMAEFLG